MKKASKIIHGGLQENSFRSVKPPIVNSTTFLRNSDGTFTEGQHVYSRSSNPNRAILEKSLSVLEEAKVSFAFSSGQAATMSIFHSIGTGKHVLISADRYHGSLALLEELYGHWGLTFTEFNVNDLKDLTSKINGQTALIWLESCSNPLLQVPDLEKISLVAKKYNLLFACDNTFATPFFCNPLNLGAQVVMNSTSKFISGHSDVIGGAISLGQNASDNLVNSIFNFQKLSGAVPSPADCALLQRSLETFHVRMPVHASNALELASYLESHPNIEKVNYPGLASHENHAIAKKQMQGGFGGVLSVLFKGNETQTFNFLGKLKLVKQATSLGGVETLVEQRRSVEGPSPVSPANLIRVSVGIEPITDLIADFKQALSS